MQTTTTYFPSLQSIEAASKKLKKVASLTPLSKNIRYSKQFDCNVLFKREDLQQVRSYKIRGAYNKMSSLNEGEIENVIVCASAGNHAQGVALSCKL
jgi:threonine dehydratase